MSIYRILPENAALQTNDADASVEPFAQGVARDFPLRAADIALIPPTDTIDKIVVTWVAKDPDGEGDTIKAGVLSGGLRQYGEQRILDATGYFPDFIDEFAVDASDGLPWTIAKLQAAQLTGLAMAVTGADPRMTQLVIDAHTTPPPKGTRITSQSPKADGTSQGPRAIVAGQAPRAGVESQAPIVSRRSQGPQTAAAPQGPTAGLSSNAPRLVTPADLPTLRVAFASQAPRVASFASQAPHATGTAQAPRGEGS